MKQIFILLAVLFSAVADAQVTNNTAWYRYSKRLSGGDLEAENAFRLPLKADTTFTPARVGMAVYRTLDSAVYVSISTTGRKWAKVGIGGGSGFDPGALRIDDSVFFARKLDVYTRPETYSQTQALGRLGVTVTGFPDSSGLRICQGDTCWDLVYPVATSGGTSGSGRLYYAGTGLTMPNDSTFALNATTSLVGEGTNLYYTDARARAALSVTGNGSYNNTTGVITINAGTTYSTTDNNLTISGSDISTKKAIQTLTDGATITWDVAVGFNAVVTLAGNRTLAITNPQAGQYYTLRVVQDATGSRTLTLPTGSRVINGGAGAVTLTTTGGAVDMLVGYWNGTNYFWTIGKNYN